MGFSAILHAGKYGIDLLSVVIPHVKHLERTFHVPDFLTTANHGNQHIRVRTFSQGQGNRIKAHRQIENYIAEQAAGHPHNFNQAVSLHKFSMFRLQGAAHNPDTIPYFMKIMFQCGRSQQIDIMRSLDHIMTGYSVKEHRHITELQVSVDNSHGLTAQLGQFNGQYRGHGGTARMPLGTKKRQSTCRQWLAAALINRQGLDNVRCTKGF